MITARNLAFAGAIEDDVRYSRKAAEILTAYADAFPGRHTSATAGGILYQSLDEAVHFIYLAQAYDLVAQTDVLTSAARTHIEENLLWECAEGLIACGISGNWGSWHLSAVGVIGFATGNQRLKDYGISNFKTQITKQLGNDGLWPESVHTYHFYPMRGFLHLAEAALAEGLDLYRWEAKPGKSLEAMFTQPLQYAYPNMQLPAINDGWYDSFLPLGIYELGYSRLKHPELGWAVKQLRQRGSGAGTDNPDASEIWSVVHGENVPDELPAPHFASTNFETIGICTLRHGRADGQEAMVTFDYGRHLGHGQADKMGFTLFARGRPLMADFGTPSYGSSILRYYTGTASHNTIMIDGKNQPRTMYHGLKAFVDQPELKAAVAETTEVAKGVSWTRAVMLAEEYVLVVDFLNSDELHQYDSLLHCSGESLYVGADHALIDVSTETLGLPWFQDTKRYAGKLSTGTITWKEKDRAVLNSAFAIDTPAQLYTATAPGSGSETGVPVVIQRVTGSDAAIANLLQLRDDEPLPTLEATGTGFTVTGIGFTDRLSSAAQTLSWQRMRENAADAIEVNILEESGK
jgi:hypothetical protein